MVSILRKGYKLVFIETPKLSPVPIFFQPPKLPQKVILLEMEINKLIEKRAVEFAPPGTSGYYSHMFLVSKGENKWRPIIDLSVLNTMLWILSFHMETPESIRTAIQLNDWTVSIDLSDAFLHIPVNVQDRKYLRFAYKGESLHFRALPFGLATSPWLFTQIMIEVKIMALQKGIIIHQYLDDWLIRSPSKQVLLNQTVLLALCKTLGLRINLEKSELTPTRDFIFVGYQYRTQINRVYPTQKRIEQYNRKQHYFSILRLSQQDNGYLLQAYLLRQQRS